MYMIILVTGISYQFCQLHSDIMHIFPIMPVVAPFLIIFPDALLQCTSYKLHLKLDKWYKLVLLDTRKHWRTCTYRNLIDKPVSLMTPWTIRLFHLLMVSQSSSHPKYAHSSGLVRLSIVTMDHAVNQQARNKLELTTACWPKTSIRSESSAILVI